jgi:hypothetical protein
MILGDSVLITGNLTSSMSKTNFIFLSLKIFLMSCKELRFSAKLTSDQGVTKSECTHWTFARQLSAHTEALLSMR